MHAKAILLVLCLLATAIAAVFAAPVSRAATVINGQLVEETGPTSVLGGGDHVFVRFGSDAAFGVVYGTTANPNNVYIVAIKARYLGVAQVADTQNRTIAENRPIKIYTLYAVKLDSIIEFRDTNRNNVADYGRLYNSTTGRFSDYFNRLDTLYKKVDLRTNWTRDTIQQSSDSTNRTWTFNLTAGNLSYANVANHTGSTALPPPTVRFTFHLNASLEEVNNATVPQWRVTVDTAGGRNDIVNLTRMANLVVSGKAVHYDLKWDQSISGWSYDGANTGTRRRLFLELGAVVGNLIPAALVDAWFDARAMGRFGETGTASFNSTVGAERANDTTGPYLVVRRLTSPSVDFGGNSTRIARLVWVSNAVVDGAPSVVYGQIVSGVRFASIGENGNAFVGFALLAGLSFQGGATIVHDPAVTTDVQADLQLPASPGSGLLTAAIVAAVAVVAAVLLIVLLLTRRRKRKQAVPPPPPET